MTLRAFGLLLVGVGLGVIGWSAGWPELTALGAAAASLVLVALILAGRAPRATLRLQASVVHAIREQPLDVRLSVSTSRRGRGLRVVEGHAKHPLRTVAVPAIRAGEPVDLTVPADTSRRGEHLLGPFTVLRGDPWSIVRRVCGPEVSGTLLVRPRVLPVGRGVGAARRIGDAEALSRQRGDDHFFALRDYVLGDEPRNVHWRSSARSGRLVVKQKVAAASDGVLFVLDCDATSFGSSEAFSGAFVEERFEAAVEVIASLCVARCGGVERVHLAPTARRAGLVGISPSGSWQPLVDVLAVVTAVPPVDAVPEEIGVLVRRTRCSEVVIVTGTPGPALVAAARRSGAATTVVRVADPVRQTLTGLRVVDVEDARSLA